MSYFDELEEIYEQTKIVSDWKEFRKALRERKQPSAEELRNRRTKDKIRAIKLLGGCCYKCGLEYHHSAMEFHHVRGEKTAQISQLLTRDWEKVKEELKKCILVCSNCHAVEHWEEKHPGEGRYGPITPRV